MIRKGLNIIANGKRELDNSGIGEDSLIRCGGIADSENHVERIEQRCG
jgi:hypothetical protein